MKPAPQKSPREQRIEHILRMAPSYSRSELEALSEQDLILLKVKVQYEYDRHNVNLFKKGYSFHRSKNWGRQNKNP